MPPKTHIKSIHEDGRVVKAVNDIEKEIEKVVQTKKKK